VACKMQHVPTMLKINWKGGAALLRLTSGDRCNWGYCGGGPSFKNVKRTHFVSAIEALLVGDHPAAQEARNFVQSSR